MFKNQIHKHQLVIVMLHSSMGFTNLDGLILNDRLQLPAQPVDATHALKRSAGV